jgi:hypothetical protein
VLFARRRPEDPTVAFDIRYARGYRRFRTPANARRGPYPDYQAAILFRRALNDRSAWKVGNVKPCMAPTLPESKAKSARRIHRN